jgi:nitrogen fixation protein FixH
LSEQEIYVIVQDQNLKPVAQAQVTIDVRLPSGEILQVNTPLVTDEDGVAVFKFTVPNIPAGEVIVDVSAKYRIYEATAGTSFRIWR